MKKNNFQEDCFSFLPSSLKHIAVFTFRQAMLRLSKIKWPINAIVLAHGWKNKEITYSDKEILSDIDLFVISNFIPFFWKKLLAMGKKIEKHSNMGFHYRGAMPFFFNKSKTFWAYRLKNEGIVIKGNSNILQKIQATSGNIASRESIRMLFQTLVLWLIAAENKNYSSSEKTYLALRGYMNIGEAYLVLTGRLAPTYKQRQQQFEMIAKELSLEPQLIQKIISSYKVKTDYSYLKEINLKVTLKEAKQDCLNVIEDILSRYLNNYTTIDKNLDTLSAKLTFLYQFNLMYYFLLKKSQTIRPHFFPLIFKFKVSDLYKIAFYHQTNQKEKRDIMLKQFFIIDNFTDKILIQLFKIWPLPTTVEM